MTISEQASPPAGYAGAHSPPPAYWFWPLRLDEAARGRVYAAAGWARPFCRKRRWLAAGAFCGAVPVLLSEAARVPGHQLLAASLLCPLLLACVREDDERAGLGLLASAFLFHALAVFGWSFADPWDAEVFLPDAQAYWRKQHEWIVTGRDPEYAAAVWAPAHLLLAAASILYTYCSLGWITLVQGFQQTDLMNFYTAQLARGSAHPAWIAAVGWHLWSLLRGAGFLFITYEVLSRSLERMTGRRLSEPRARRRRWLLGLGLLLADAAAKACLMEPAREELLRNWSGG